MNTTLSIEEEALMSDLEQFEPDCITVDYLKSHHSRRGDPIFPSYDYLLPNLPQNTSEVLVCFDYDETIAHTSPEAKDAFTKTINETYPDLTQIKISQALQATSGTTEANLVAQLSGAINVYREAGKIFSDTLDFAQKRIKNHENPAGRDEMGYFNPILERMEETKKTTSGRVQTMIVTGNPTPVFRHRSGLTDIPCIGGENALTRRGLLEIAAATTKKLIYCGDAPSDLLACTKIRSSREGLYNSTKMSPEKLLSWPKTEVWLRVISSLINGGAEIEIPFVWYCPPSIYKDDSFEPIKDYVIQYQREHPGMLDLIENPSILNQVHSSPHPPTEMIVNSLFNR